MSTEWVRSDIELTNWVGLGTPVDCFFPDRLVLVVARTFEKVGDQSRVEVSASAPPTPGAQRSFIPFVHDRGPTPSARGPFAVSPDSRFSFHVSLRENVGELAQFGVVGAPLTLPHQPLSAAVSDDGSCQVSLVDGRLWCRAPSGEVTVREGLRYPFMNGSAGALFAATTAGTQQPGLFVHGARGALRVDLKNISIGHFAFAGTTLVGLEANGPVWVHRVDLAAQRHHREALERSVDVLAIDPKARRALTCDDQQLYVVDLATRLERPAPFPRGVRPRLAAIDPHLDQAWVVSQDAERRWWFSRVQPA